VNGDLRWHLSLSAVFPILYVASSRFAVLRLFRMIKIVGTHVELRFDLRKVLKPSKILQCYITSYVTRELNIVHGIIALFIETYI